MGIRATYVATTTGVRQVRFAVWNFVGWRWQHDIVYVRQIVSEYT